jgi:hypothetical protein
MVHSTQKSSKMEPLDINSLEDLHKEKRKLKLRMEVTKQEFEKSLTSSRKEMGTFLLKKVLLPVGAAGLGVAAVRYFTHKGEKHKDSHQENHQPPPRFSQSRAAEPLFSVGAIFNQLLPLATSILQAWLLKKINDEGQAQRSNGARHHEDSRV